MLALKNIRYLNVKNYINWTACNNIPTFYALMVHENHLIEPFSSSQSSAKLVHIERSLNSFRLYKNQSSNPF